LENLTTFKNSKKKYVRMYVHLLHVYTFCTFSTFCTPCVFHVCVPNVINHTLHSTKQQCFLQKKCNTDATREHNVFNNKQMTLTLSLSLSLYLSFTRTAIQHSEIVCLLRYVHYVAAVRRYCIFTCCTHAQQHTFTQRVPNDINHVLHSTKQPRFLQKKCNTSATAVRQPVQVLHHMSIKTHLVQLKTCVDI